MVTMYRAAKIAGVTPEAIRKQTLKLPVPLFFKKFKDGSFMVDEDHQLFKYYVQSIRTRKGKTGEEHEKFQRLLKAVIAEIDERYHPDSEVMDEILQGISDRSGL